MTVPSHRRSSSRVRRARAHLALTPTPTSVCPKCKFPIKPHHACANCGTYRTREVLRTRMDKKAAQMDKKERKSKAASQKKEA